MSEIDTDLLEQYDVRKNAPDESTVEFLDTFEYNDRDVLVVITSWEGEISMGRDGTSQCKYREAVSINMDNNEMFRSHSGPIKTVNRNILGANTTQDNRPYSRMEELLKMVSGGAKSAIVKNLQLDVKTFDSFDYQP